MSGPGDVNLADHQPSDSELARSIRQRLLFIAEQVVSVHGYANLEQRLVLAPLRKYVKDCLLDGHDPKSAPPDLLRRAWRVLPSLEGQLMRRTDIVGGMIEYADD